MTMRWWIEVKMDGRKHKLRGGPRAKPGRFSLVIKQHDGGISVPVLNVWGIARADGGLQLCRAAIERKGGD